MDSIVISTVSSDDFSGFEQSWNDLVSRSDADKLFMGWVWLHNWWKAFFQQDSMQLCLLAVYDGQKLVGIAPLYLAYEKTKVGKISRLQFLGNRWRDRTNIRSEYMDFIIDRDYEDAVISKIAQFLFNDIAWDELTVCNHIAESSTVNRLLEYAKEKGAVIRVHEPGCTHCVVTHGSFDEYLKELSPSTRSKLYNQRKKLLKSSEVELVEVAPDQSEKLLQILNQFHQNRWEKKLFDHRRLNFHTAVVRELAQRGCLDSSFLIADGEIVSALYDYKVGKAKYGIQLGFNPNFNNKVSISQLHFGHAIEKAFNTELETYDFLRGIGKSKKSYKDSIAKPYRDTQTTQIIRKPTLKLAYKLYDIYKSQFKNNASE